MLYFRTGRILPNGGVPSGTLMIVPCDSNPHGHAHANEAY